jgi:hypothetical protein
MEVIKRFPINWSMAIAFKGAEEQGSGNQVSGIWVTFQPPDFLITHSLITVP